jgi:ligand-binding sensor domain-containing protein/two-component sensor histidine kinase
MLSARRLPIQIYTTANGLARDNIRCIVQDSHSFLWFCTTEGLSRFDGYEFVNYGAAQGLPSNVINGFLETGDGLYWVATETGLCRFDARSKTVSRFHCLSSSHDGGVPRPWVLYPDGEGGVWCGTITAHDGLYHLARGETSFRHVDLPMATPSVTALRRDRNGVLWIGSPDGLYLLDRTGHSTVLGTAEGLPNGFIMALLEDRDGRMWVGTREGLAQIETKSGQRSIRTFGLHDGLPGPRIESLLQTRDGAIWAGTTGGLAELVTDPAQGGRKFRSYTLAQGLSARTVGSLTEDREANLWVGTFGSGAMKVARNGFTTYSDEDGATSISSLFTGRGHALCAVSRRTENGPDLQLGCFEGERFYWTRLAWPKTLSYFGWGHGQIAAQDAHAEWWIATGHGLYRFPRAERVEALAGAYPVGVYTTRDGLPGDNIYCVFADSHDGIWIGTIGPRLEDALSRWDRASSSLHIFSDAELMPKAVPTAFAEDRAGNVWVGFYHGGLARYRNGSFDLYGSTVGLEGDLNSLLIDSQGRLWIATSLGLMSVSDPTSEHVRFERYRASAGLSSDDVTAVTEDHFGRIYAATGRGIDRFEPTQGRLGPVKHYTRADGIVPGELNLALCDREGNLWFSTPLGVSRFIPGTDPAVPPPPVLITGLNVGGVPQAIPDLGASSIPALRLPRAPLRISFVGLGYSPGETMRYEYRLRDEETWSPLTGQRSVTYANLSPGDHMFEVRAVAGDGLASPEPATVAFTVLPPLWRHWWFLAACLAFTAAAVYAMHKYRVNQLLAVANMRTRIATDLHDDIGASLSQIAILSEVARHEIAASGAPVQEPLSAIAGLSREVVDSMSDIVWAIAPEHDRLTDLVYCMRRFAGDLLAAREIALHFRTAIAEHDLRVNAGARRQLYLIFKEAIHNIARHSRASEVEIQLARDAAFVYLRIRDNGVGFDPDAEYDGRGLRSMRKRAETMAGKMQVESSKQGTTIWITVHLDSVKSL